MMIDLFSVERPITAGIVLTWTLMPGGAHGAVFDLPITIRDSSATVEVNVGTPPVSHSLTLNTAIGTTWLIDTECVESGWRCPNTSKWPRTPYNSTASSTSTIVGNLQGISDRATTKNVGGIPTSDIFSFPITQNVTSSLSPSHAQTFLDVGYRSEWEANPADGMLGLRFGASVANISSVFETLMAKNMLEAPRFSVYWGREVHTETEGAASGRLTLGGSKEDVYVAGGTDGLGWVPVELDPDVLKCCGKWYTDWATHISGAEAHFTLSSGAVATSLPDAPWEKMPGRAIFDSNIPNIQVPGGYIQALYRAMGMEYSPGTPNPWMEPCSNFNSSWSVTFKLGREAPGEAVNLTLNGEQLRMPGYAGREEICHPPFEMAYPYTGIWKFGALAMRSVYMVYDYGSFDLARKDFKARMGFGMLKKEWEPRLG